jgi:muramoyltetrapeptide carboxypeptidase
MAVTPRTRAGLIKFRPVRAGSRVALVAPASPFGRAAFDAGLAELRRLGLDPVYDDSVFAEGAIVAGPADVRAAALERATAMADVDAVIAVRGGYGSAEILPRLAAAALRRHRTAVVGYSDITSLHAFLNGHVQLASVHGAMIEGRLAKGPAAYDPASFLASLGTAPMGEVSPDGLTVLRPGEARGPLFGGTLMQLAASLGTPYEFVVPGGSVLFLEDVGERPYRVRRLLTQLSQAGRFTGASAVVCGEFPRCDEPAGTPAIVDVLREFFAGFPGPVLFGFPSGHTTRPLVSLPFGVEVQVIATGRDRPAVVFREAAAE